jgi:uncharacterized membrane protein YqiK
MRAKAQAEAINILAGAIRQDGGQEAAKIFIAKEVKFNAVHHGYI